VLTVHLKGNAFKVIEQSHYIRRTNQMKLEFKKIAMGVLAASVGAVAFGAIHYYFLSGMTGNLFGVSYGTILPIVAGALGLVGAYGFVKTGMVHDILVAGSAASI
jgi:hypothetical protein